MISVPILIWGARTLEHQNFNNTGIQRPKYSGWALGAVLLVESTQDPKIQHPSFSRHNAIISPALT